MRIRVGGAQNNLILLLLLIPIVIQPWFLRVDSVSVNHASRQGD